MAESLVYEIADRYVERAAALDPCAATFEGIAGYDAELTNYAPDAAEERAEHARHTLRALATAPRDTDRDRVAAEVMEARLRLDVDLYAAGEHLRDLNVLGSPVQAVREVFDLMDTSTLAAWETIAARMAAVPEALDTLRDAYDEGIRQGLVAARRQVVGCVEQAEVWSGHDAARTRPFFLRLVDRFDELGHDEPALRSTLLERADRATEAYASFARFLAQEYSPHATERDAVGEPRYALWARVFNGTQLDLSDTYAWGWDELHRIETLMASVGERILPGAPLPEVIDLLETDPARAIEGEHNLRAWLQDLMDRTIAELHDVHFDIPEPVRRVEAMIAPPGGAAAMYYTGPSEDFTRPGRTWYPTLGKTRFPLWAEVTTCYHEGVPGHHLQIGEVRYLADALSRFQRTFGFVSGHGEGWALYAERLMGELGYLDVPDYELGLLHAQALRAARVVIDIGMHLELAIPRGERFHPGEVWDAELANELIVTRTFTPPAFTKSEVDRYLGLPGQAISYKVGERVWLEAREDGRRRHGSGFDLKAWHAFGLDLGPLGLDQLRRELARF